jgi:HK97 gp10 family phage protein
MVIISGFEEFSEDLEEFADDLEQIADSIDEAVDEGVKDTAQDVETTASEKAPVDSGALRADIRATRMEIAKWSIGSTKKYAPPTEYGSEPHPITPNGPYPLVFYWEKKGRWATPEKVEHPGTPAQPFLRPGLAKHRKELTQNINDAIQELIDEEM